MGKKIILFTGGGGAGSEALNSLLLDSHITHFADADITAKPYSLPSSQWHQIPYASDPDFIKGLQELCNKLNIDLLIPGVDEELIPIAHNRDGFNCHIILPPLDFLSTHLDKYTSNKDLKKSGIPVPKTFIATQIENISFPCIIKPRKGRGSRGFAVINSEKELKAQLLLSHLPPDEFIVQELLVGQEYTVTMVSDMTGKLQAVVPVKVALKKGITIRANTEYNEDIIRACNKIHAAYLVPGIYNIQLIVTETGEIKPFEINPRISTTACLALAAGVPIINLYCHDVIESDELAIFLNNLFLRRTWKNEFIKEETD
ncbi:ATP-grasp domain-containing protein [Methanospirillum sp. J.3.6.1-F.2.7.3]|uniref:ATP-grasp domain-containing protein n=1 Tax=Methanospirillum purgamenti TaxID=2834276 RepID=A0A8E7AXK0_9EURY|nr:MULTISPECIES: ATP-grasp domain-containing protein [Methanospirillum]MDX8549493.1 ATP-grasp domain-containing protein [Methanospirillum hungatei]QVV89225.1 ATP-grasp domain-containing protein [Methanospirillum sp. J.3.6.1-F.2.7.3]